MKNIILASKSPRRAFLLSGIGLKYDIIDGDADESSVSKELEPGLYTQELALLKAAAAAKKLKSAKNAVIISADTVVVLDGRILGKPSDEDDAFSMLKDLSGRTHEVYTGYCVMRGSDGFAVCKSEKTAVTFKRLDDEKIRAYIATGEPMDKAGAYGIQEKGATLVEKIDGDYFNVVGLPLSSLADTMEKEFDINILKKYNKEN